MTGSVRRRQSAAAVAGTGLLGLAVAVRAFQAQAVDLAVYRAAGAAVLSGEPLYRGPVTGALAFTYPPFAALLFTPLAVLPAAVCKAAVVLLNCAVLLFVARRSWRSVSAVRGRALAAAVVVTASAAMLTEAVRYDVYIGQINLVLLALVVADLTGPDEGRMRGVGVGLAAGIKLTPLVFVAYLLAVRRFRAAAVATGTFAGTILVGCVLPGDSHRYWLQGTFADSGRVYGDAGSTHNQSLRGLLLRAGLGEGRASWVWPVLGLAVGAVALVAAVRATRAGRRLQAATVCGLCGAALSPWSWGHHWVWIVPLAVVAAHRVLVSAARTPWLVVLALLPLTLPRVRGLADPLDGDGPPVFGSGPAALLLGNPYLLIFAATLVAGLLDPGQAGGADRAVGAAARRAPGTPEEPAAR